MEARRAADAAGTPAPPAEIILKSPAELAVARRERLRSPPRHCSPAFMLGPFSPRLVTVWASRRNQRISGHGCKAKRFLTFDRRIFGRASAKTHPRLRPRSKT